MWRNKHYWNIAVMTVIAIVLVCCTALYEFRYTIWGLPYDWSEIRAAGRLRVAAIEGDTAFAGQISRFCEEKNLNMEVKYYRHSDELWLSLVTLKADLAHFPNDEGEYSWKTRERSEELRDTVDLWYDRNVRKISRWDEYFKMYGDSIGWDWKMLAAIGYVESRFKNINGATGLGIMQLSRGTATKFGAKGSLTSKPQHNIKAAANYISYLDSCYSEVKSKRERTKFVLAAYNAGGSPVRAAMARAKSHKKDPYKWENVEKYFRNNHSKRYLKKILAKYDEYCVME